jgi:hypothetical protein
MRQILSRRKSKVILVQNISERLNMGRVFVLECNQIISVFEKGQECVTASNKKNDEKVENNATDSLLISSGSSLKQKQTKAQKLHLKIHWHKRCFNKNLLMSAKET